MMVIKSVDGFIYPADRCVWQQTTSGDSWAIELAKYEPATGAPVDIKGAQLGYIGKSGKFIPITD